MVTKLEALAAYNEQHGTTYTLTELATELLRLALKDAWLHKRRNEVLAPLDSEIIV